MSETIANLERDYAVHKEKFEKWKKTNAKLAGNATYNCYVEQFVNWERGVFEQLRELRAALARRPVCSEPQLPMVDLDTQLNEVLRKITQTEFIVAVFAMAHKDPSFLPNLFKVVHRESKGTGCHTMIMPNTPPQVNFSVPPPPIIQMPISNTTYATNIMPNTSLPPPNVITSQSQMVYPSHLSMQQNFSQVSQYSTMPEGWVIDDPIRKRPKYPSPKRDYRNPTNLPFKDFSQS